MQNPSTMRFTSNKINGLFIRHSDMTFEMIESITKLISLVRQSEKNWLRISRFLTQQLNIMYPTGWICIVGNDFLANIVHQSNCFLKITCPDSLNLLIYKIKE